MQHLFYVASLITSSISLRSDGNHVGAASNWAFWKGSVMLSRGVKRIAVLAALAFAIFQSISSSV